MLVLNMSICRNVVGIVCGTTVAGEWWAATLNSGFLVISAATVISAVDRAAVVGVVFLLSSLHFSQIFCGLCVKMSLSVSVGEFILVRVRRLFCL